MQKFSSNVLDKLISHYELFNFVDEKDLLKMIQSQYGNMVLQNMVNNLIVKGIFDS